MSWVLFSFETSFTNNDIVPVVHLNSVLRSCCPKGPLGRQMRRLWSWFVTMASQLCNGPNAVDCRFKTAEMAAFSYRRCRYPPEYICVLSRLFRFQVAASVPKPRPSPTPALSSVLTLVLRPQNRDPIGICYLHDREGEGKKKTLNLSPKVHDILNWTEGKGVRLPKVYEVGENF